jgi:glucosamine--fructose-6-phosphate aminotransferase (isomerizing)
MSERGRTEPRMAAEFKSVPDLIRQQAEPLGGVIAELVAALARRPPGLVVTCARGSSAHAATFAKHLIERHLGLPVAAAAPNIATIYGRKLKLDGQLFLAISQSGRSDDLIECAGMAKAAGALTAALVNDTASPLAAACRFVLPMAAGPELSVAATKSFIASLAALLRLTAAWTGDEAMRGALVRLPDRLAIATLLDWGAAAGALRAAASLVTIGRGPTLAIAREAALKLKETCNLHAEAFSGAEFLHGPVALVESAYPVLVFPPTDAAAAGLRELADSLRRKGASVFTAEAGDPAPGRLPALKPDHPETDAICLIQSFYALVLQLAAQRGIDADLPRHLRKVTRTR